MYRLQDANIFTIYSKRVSQVGQRQFAGYLDSCGSFRASRYFSFFNETGNIVKIVRKGSQHVGELGPLIDANKYTAILK